MKKKLLNFLTVLAIIMTVTLSTVVASVSLSPLFADEDDPDLGDMTPLIVSEYV